MSGFVPLISFNLGCPCLKPREIFLSGFSAHWVTMEIPTISAHRVLRTQHVCLLFQSQAWVGKLFLGWPSWYPEPSFPRSPICTAASTNAPQVQADSTTWTGLATGTVPSNTPDLHLLPNVKLPPAFYQLIPLPTLFSSFCPSLTDRIWHYSWETVQRNSRNITHKSVSSEIILPCRYVKINTGLWSKHIK